MNQINKISILIILLVNLVFSQNDIDDATVVLLIRYAFVNCELSSDEQKVLDQLNKIIDPWFNKLKIK